MDRAPGRIGFMSTQRRENRWQRRSCTDRAGASGQARSASGMRPCHAFASGVTAPPGAPACFDPSEEDLSPGAPEWWATNSLQTDHFLGQLVRSVCPGSQDIRRWTPPSGAGSRAVTGAVAAPRSSFLPISISSGLATFSRTLPQAPAGRRRWAERYDGKRDLHLQHAA